MTDHIGEDYHRLKKQAAEYRKAAHVAVEFVEITSIDELAAAILQGYSVSPIGPIWVPSSYDSDVIDAVKVVDRTHEQTPSPEPEKIETCQPLPAPKAVKSKTSLKRLR